MKVRKIGFWTFVLGFGLLAVSFHYDWAHAGGHSWDDPPELTAPYEHQLKIAHRLYSAAWTLLALGLILILFSSMRRRLWNREARH